MILGIKATSGQARCIFTGEMIPKGESVVEVQISKVQVRQASLEGLRLALGRLVDGGTVGGLSSARGDSTEGVS